ncbi:MFS transporter [Ktedonobacter racemifer]|uniref:Major facilitator superfamily MFS_1 n=1 Tax=Ktedonobacter racemifer DSM 44963 TaxID=485913 RepID=D6U418_KTERA|nr:MFS transporter [Ktedonobacter racemifer]EFH81256.1 major facilitator superfamily MFS_1 [Ktedonobacter racemifer DSM 44963]
MASHDIPAVPQTDEQVPEAVVPRSFWLNRAFGLLWSGQTVSLLGSHITGSAIPFIAIMLLGATPLQVGLLSLFASLPTLLFSLPIGAWVDRLPRRPMLVLADMGRGLLLLSLPIAVLFGQISLFQLLLVAFLTSTLTICFDTAYQAFLPQVVRHAQLVEGNSKLGTSESLAEVAGPPLAGVLIQWLSAPLAVFFDALSFLFSALSIGLIHSGEIELVPVVEERASLWEDMRSGLRILFSYPLLRTLAIYDTLKAFCAGVFALYAIFVLRDLHLSPVLYGILIAVGGVSALIGSFLAPALIQRYGARRALLYGLIVDKLTALATPLAFGGPSLAFALLALAQMGDIGYALFSINEISLRQQQIPAHQLGRVNAAINFLVNGIGPLGALLAGLLAEVIGVRYTLLCGVCAMMLNAAWLAVVLWRQK